MSVVVAESMSRKWPWVTDFVANLRYRLMFYGICCSCLNVQLILLVILKPPAHVSTTLSSLQPTAVTRNAAKLIQKKMTES